MLLGFCDEMQLEIADDLVDFVCDRVVHTTNCPSADAVLLSCYEWIAEEKVKKAEAEIKRLMDRITQLEAAGM